MRRKVAPEVAKTLKCFTGYPKRVSDVVELSGNDSTTVLNHIRSARQAGIPIECIGPMAHRYFFIPKPELVQVKETYFDQIKDILSGSSEEDYFTTRELAELVDCSQSTVTSVLSKIRLHTNLNLRCKQLNLAKKGYWLESK